MTNRCIDQCQEWLLSLHLIVKHLIWDVNHLKQKFLWGIGLLLYCFNFQLNMIKFWFTLFKCWWLWFVLIIDHKYLFIYFLLIWIKNLSQCVKFAESLYRNQSFAWLFDIVMILTKNGVLLIIYPKYFLINQVFSLGWCWSSAFLIKIR